MQGAGGWKSLADFTAALREEFGPKCTHETRNQWEARLHWLTHFTRDAVARTNGDLSALASLWPQMQVLSAAFHNIAVLGCAYDAEELHDAVDRFSRAESSTVAQRCSALGFSFDAAAWIPELEPQPQPPALPDKLKKPPKGQQQQQQQSQPPSMHLPPVLLQSSQPVAPPPPSCILPALLGRRPPPPLADPPNNLRQQGRRVAHDLTSTLATRGPPFAWPPPPLLPGLQPAPWRQLDNCWQPDSSNDRRWCAAAATPAVSATDAPAYPSRQSWSSQGIADHQIGCVGSEAPAVPAPPRMPAGGLLGMLQRGGWDAVAVNEHYSQALPIASGSTSVHAVTSKTNRKVRPRNAKPLATAHDLDADAGTQPQLEQAPCIQAARRLLNKQQGEPLQAYQHQNNDDHDYHHQHQHHQHDYHSSNSNNRNSEWKPQQQQPPIPTKARVPTTEQRPNAVAARRQRGALGCRGIGKGRGGGRSRAANSRQLSSYALQLRLQEEQQQQAAVAAALAAVPDQREEQQQQQRQAEGVASMATMAAAAAEEEEDGGHRLYPSPSLSAATPWPFVLPASQQQQQHPVATTKPAVPSSFQVSLTSLHHPSDSQPQSASPLTLYTDSAAADEPQSAQLASSQPVNNDLQPPRTSLSPLSSQPLPQPHQQRAAYAPLDRLQQWPAAPASAVRGCGGRGRSGRGRGRGGRGSSGSGGLFNGCNSNQQQQQHNHHNLQQQQPSNHSRFR